MTFEAINQLIESIGLPCAYYQFSETGQEPPFICFYYSYNNDLAADNTNYQKIEHLIIELYTETKDFDLEKQVEDALKLNEMVYSRSETDIDSERMYEVIYEMDVIITEGE